MTGANVYGNSLLKVIELFDFLYNLGVRDNILKRELIN
jgi:hypothetical protein